MTLINLTNWLTRLVADLTEEGPVTRFELYHGIEAEPAERLEVYKNLTDSPRVPDELAREILTAAEADLESRVASTPQRYFVQAFRRDGEVHDAQHGFLMRPKHGRSRFDDSEPPTDKGVMAYAMRHAESSYRLLADAGQALLGKLSAEIERERRLRLDAEEQCTRMMRECQSLLDESQERKLAEAREIMRQKRIDEVIGSVVPLVPLLIERLLVNNVPAVATPSQALAATTPEMPKMTQGDPIDHELCLLIRGLKEKEVHGVLGGLDVKNKVVFAELIDVFRKSEETIGGRKTATERFLANLSEREAFALFNALEPMHQRQLMQIYTHFKSVDEAAQKQKPEILRS